MELLTRGAAAWGLALTAGCAVAMAQGPRPAVPAEIRQLGVAGSANSNPTLSARGSFVAVAWGATTPGKGTDVYVALSRDAGATFGAPVRANAESGEARISAERPPVVALVPSNRATPDVAVLWTAGGSGTPLKLARSGDGGRTFARPREVQAPGAPGNRGWASMTADQAGTLHVVWLDHRDTAGAAAGRETSGHAHRDGAAMAQRSGLYYAQVGTGAIAERLLARGVCYCCKTAVAAGPGNRVATAWRHVYPGNLRDIAAATSADAGRTFTTPQRVSEDGWAIDGCPENGPSIAFHDGRLHLAWPTVLGGREPAGAIFYAYSRGGGSFSSRIRVPVLAGRDPEHVQIAGADAGRVVVAWDEVVDGRRTVVASRLQLTASGAAVGAPTLVSPGRPARHPALAPAPGGVLVAWTDGPSETATAIGIRRISN
jgi:hypothetical protein